MKQREALLPGTDALGSGTVEWVRWRGKILVRYRDDDGSTQRRTFTERDKAHEFFAACVEKLKGGSGRSGVSCAGVDC